MTAQDVINLARVPLNDPAKVRYLDADMLRALNAGLSHLKIKRPDLFIGSLSTGQTALVLADALPTPDGVDQALADYVTARASMVDAEFSVDRVAAFLALAEGQL